MTSYWHRAVYRLGMRYEENGINVRGEDMASHFTKAELFRLRNEIKIRFVIQSLLNIPIKEHEGITR